MSYQVRLYNQFINNISPTIQVSDGIISYTNTTIGLVGDDYVNYSQGISESLVWQLENFAGPLEPADPLVGQLWFDSNASSMKYYNGVQWIALSSTEDDFTSVPSDIIPSVNGLYNLGSGTFRWANVYANSINLNGTSYSSIGDLISDGSVLLSGSYDVDAAPNLGLVSKEYVLNQIISNNDDYLALAGGDTMIGNFDVFDDTGGLVVTDSRAVSASYISTHYLDKAGDTMIGTLTLEDASVAASQAFVTDRTDWIINNDIISTQSLIANNLTRYRVNTSSDVTITIESSTAEYFQIISVGTGLITIVAGSGVTLTGLGSTGQGTVVSFLYTSVTDAWDAVGDLA